jgi:hypothetical protein
MAKKERNQIILAKIETTYGTDATPTGAANAILAVNIQPEPILGTQVSRDLMLPYLGHQGMVLSGTYGRLKFEVELAGSGAAGTAPAWGPLLRGCGMAEVITAGQDTKYNFVSQSEESLSLYYNEDGIKHVLVGARGAWTFQASPSAIPRLVFTFTGLLGTITDAAAPAVTLTSWKKPVPVNKTNTTLNLHGYTGPCESFSVDTGIQIAPRLLINGESIEISDRKVTGQAVVELAPLATIDWFNRALNATDGTLAFQHGIVAGNIVQMNGGVVQVGPPTYGATNGIRNITTPLMLKPSAAGNDELQIVVK